QAEDGIRDFHVTGVQTCALPISGLASIFLVETGHDLEDGRLTGAVRTENTDLRVGIEGEMDILQNLLVAIGLVEAGHVINKLACHKARRLHGLESADGFKRSRTARKLLTRM